MPHHIGMATNNSQKVQKQTNKNKQEVERLLERVGDGQAEFVMIELDTAITFCNVALSTSDPERRARNIENAVTGYKTALRFSRVPNHDLRNDSMFQEKLAHLRDLLHELGCDEA
jgi:hypothetical protein